MDQERIVAFGIQVAFLVFISRIAFLLFVIQESTKPITPLMFLRLQTNGFTIHSANIFTYLEKNKFHHQTVEELKSLCIYFLKQITEKLNFTANKFPIFIDEAQLYCPNEHKLLSDKITVTPFNTPRENDFFSLLFAAYAQSIHFKLIVSGTSFSGDVISQLNSGIEKQQAESLVVLVGQTLIESKEDFREKLKTIMNITENLDKFIDIAISAYLPMRRRIFTSSCAKILSKGKDSFESFKAAFDDSFEGGTERIFNNLKKDWGNDKNTVTAKMVLKVLFMV